MATSPRPADTIGLQPWHEAAAGPLLVPLGDLADARLRLAPAWGDDAAIEQLRLKTDALADGGDLSRLDDHTLLDTLAVAIAEHRLREPGLRPRLLPIAPAEAPPPAPASGGRGRAPSVAAPAVPDEPELDAAAMAAVLVQAAQDGVPFCEECEKARAARAEQAAA